ncbi:type II CAAX prenyl endopeptidase Rce1 family protein [Aquimarina sp. SS2-1]|uniref:CPBP family intramembrane glutamic endopeptidase n=1 Tax=Aquimarina besae TaxID=3342247 RepID=UPI00366FE3CB
MIKLEKGVWLYLFILLIATYIIQIFVITQGGENYEYFQVFIGLSMFFPGIGAIIYLIKTKKGIKYINWKLGKPLYILYSLLVPSIITLISIWFFEKIGLGTNNAFSFSYGKINAIQIPLLLGTDIQSVPFFILNFILSGIGFSLIISLLTIGEEVGWRGFLQKKLLEQNGVVKSLVFLGLVWGFWHFPLIINGMNYPEYPIWGAFLLFPLTTVCISFFMGWLTINSNSVWPAVFVHGGINSIMIVLFEMDFGEHKFVANFAILGIWAIVGFLSYIWISHKHKISSITRISNNLLG